MEEVNVLPYTYVPGIKDEIGKRIEEELRAGRRYFGVSGASLTHQAFNPAVRDRESDTPIDASAAKVGIEGERDTTHFLKNWIKDKPNAVLIDSVHIRGWGKEEVDPETGIIEGGDTDHMLVIGNEVIILDTKRWKSKTRYGISDDGKIQRADKSFPGSDVKIVPALHMWMNYLQSDRDIQYTPIIVINSPDIVVYRTRSWFQQKYRLIEINKLEEFMETKWGSISEYNKTTINPSLIAQIAVGCVKPYDPRVNVFNADSLREFEKRAQRAN